jgi:hypothetical protein
MIQRVEVLRSNINVNQRVCASLAGGGDGQIRAALEAGGAMVGGNDLWIAAHAKSAGLTLVTNNESEFKRIPDLKLQNRTRPHR